LARLVEGHVDALAILEEAGLEPEPGAVYGVWAARPPSGGTTAELTADGWSLVGSKPFCSGSTRIDRALVTADCPDGYRLFDISVAENVLRIHSGSWPAVGMADSLSDTLDFGGSAIPASRAVGPPNFYLERPGFWFGAVGVAACWYGGARGLLGQVVESLGPRPSELVVTEIGYAAAQIDLMRRALEQAAREIDADPGDRSGEAHRRALVIRQAVHQGAHQVLVHSAAAGGARPFCLDAAQAQRVADLYVYLAQHHGPRDANALGAMACEGWPWT
jgi:alkylation response protein AidB-like acyl-CoA dehydrogenase